MIEPSQASHDVPAEALLRLIVDSATDFAIFTMDPDGIATSWNTGAERLLGWSDEEMIGQSADVMFPPEEGGPAAAEEERRTALAQGRAEDERWQMRKDGTRFFASGLLMPLADRSQGFVKIFRDRTRQHRAEERLKDSEESQRRIVESATEYAILTADLDARITSWNVGGERIFGYTEAEAVGMDGRLLFTPEQRRTGDPEQEMHDALTTGRSHMEREHLRKDGSRFWTSQTLMPVRDGKGEAQGFLKILRDRSAEKAAEDRLRDSEARFRALAEGIPQLVWRSRDDGHWIGGGPQWQAYTGQPEDETRDRGWLEAVHPEDRDRTLEAWHAATAQGLLEVEHRLRRADGAFRWFSTRAVPVEDDRVRTVEWLGTSTDVHDMKQLQQRQGVLLAELQHRTRNLLAVVRSIGAQTLRASGSLPEFGQQFNSRLSALGRVQSVMSRDGEAVTLDEIVRMELLAHGAPIDGERVQVGGPVAALPAGSVQILTLAIHELATNALKYGALARPEGRLSIAWNVHDGDPEHATRLRLEWRETGVPLGEGFVPRRRGYGRQLIEAALAYDLMAETELEFTPEGVRCVIDVPLKD